MRINNNLMAMNTHRQLGISTNGGAKSMEKLSSGLRINRAGDDAAGLAISEKMRGQIRGLTQASRNAQDGISLIQTAEGALDETHAILQRMRELAVQSSTDTNTPADRANIQDEIDQLATEISRIANTTQFNTMELLNGDFKDRVFHIGANEGQNVELVINDMTSKALGLETANKLSVEVEGITFETFDADIKSVIVTANENSTANGDGSVSAALEDGVLTVNITLKNGSGEEIDEDALNAELEEFGVTAGFTTLPLDGTDENGKFEAKVATVGDIAEVYANVADKEVAKLEFAANNSGVDPDALEINIGRNSDGKKEVTVTVGQEVTLKELNDALKEHGISIQSNDKDVDGDTVVGEIQNAVELDVEAGSKAIRVDTQTAADKAITTINDALENVSKERSKLGAMQNRLEHTIKNLDTSAENLQASEARIRDVDMAKEMMEQTKQQILQQASTAMLAQANTAPQTVLQLLQ